MALVRPGGREQLIGMITLRSSLLAALLVLAAMAHGDTVADRSGPQGFDFLFGEWRVHHRIKRPTGECYEFEGTCDTRPLMAGAANVEEHVFARPTGEPATGRFENGIGNFYSDYTDPQGKTVRGRLNWSQITPTSARWEQSMSTDGGKTWEPNWVMTFKRR